LTQDYFAGAAIVIAVPRFALDCDLLDAVHVRPLRFV
jgi:hypothetical protein